MKLIQTFYNDLRHPDVLKALRDVTRGYPFWILLGLGFGWAYCYGKTLGHGIDLFLLINWVFFCLLSTLSLVDLKRFILPDILVYPLFILGLIVAPSWQAALITSFILGAGFALVRFAATKALKQEAMGLGDVKLVIALGPWVGLLGIVPFLVATSIAALIVLLIRVLTGRAGKAGRPLPFGPFLAFGGWVAYAYGATVFIYLMLFRQFLLEAF